MTEDIFGIVGTTQAGTFHVESVVAEGGFAVVYRAIHQGFRAPVALKCLKVPVAMTQAQRERFREKFREEAELLFRLSASIPEVVRPLHVDVLSLESRFVPFLALEWLEGESLDDRIARRREQNLPPMSLRKLVRLLKPIAHALSRAHEFSTPSGVVSIIHRDLKPENIFLLRGEDDDKPKILDFGIAKATKIAQEAAGHVTSEEESSAFTPAYAAPEQWMPKRFGKTGTWTDVWGLGITMLDAISPRPPIDGELHAMMGTVLDEVRRPSPRSEGVEVSDEVEGVFVRALAVRPEIRTATIAAFWTELELALGFKPSLGDADSRRESAAMLAASRFESISHRKDPTPDPWLSSEQDVQDVAVTLPRGIDFSSTALEPQNEADAFEALIGREAEELPPPASEPISLEPIPMSRAVSSLKQRPESVASAKPIEAAPPAERRQTTTEDVFGSGSDLFVDIDVERALSPAPSQKGLPQSARLGPLPDSARSLPVRRELGELRESGPSEPKFRITIWIVLIVSAVIITAGEISYVRLTGNQVQLGPVNPWWIAIPLVLVGTTMLVWQLLGRKDE